VTRHKFVLRWLRSMRGCCRRTQGGRVVTVFSAPNYCDQFGNKGAFARFNDQCAHAALCVAGGRESCGLPSSHMCMHRYVPDYISFAHVPHPQVRSIFRVATHLPALIHSATNLHADRCLQWLMLHQ
jgi:hypothetical protein